MESMLDNLLKQPLFAGISREKMAATVGKYRFHFLKYTDGEEIVRAGQPCTHIRFIVSGSVSALICNTDARFTVSQTLTAPNVLAPSYLFGPLTTYPMTVTSIGPVGILQLTKIDYLEILNSDTIFMFNFLNMLSTNAQKAVDGITTLTTGNLEERLALWLLTLSQSGASDICINGHQRSLYSLFGVQRSSFLSTLDDLAERGMVEYDSNQIRFHSRRDLTDMLQKVNHLQVANKI